MKRKYLLNKWYLLSILITLSMSGCNDTWDEHYDSGETESENIIDYINSREDLTEFAKLLEETGYDSLLSVPQSYTVWAPNNDALMNEIFNTYQDSVHLVETHIAKSKTSTSITDVKPIYMLSGKYVDFSNSDEGILFGNSSLLESNISKRNGLVHVINEKVEYLDNIYEYIGKAEGLDSLKKYIYSRDSLIFDYENSELIGYDEQDEPIYLAKYIPYNEILEEVGAFNIEDSSYTAILLDNDGWIEGYDRIYNYFNLPTLDGIDGDSLQHELTQFVLIKNMAVRGKDVDFASLDSVITTTSTTTEDYTVIYEPGYLTEGLNRIPLSNGTAYITNELRIPDTTSFLKEIRVEAEISDGRDNSNNVIATRNILGSELPISKKSYLYVGSTSTNALSPSSVSFQIPNVYSTKYNVYCVFVPNDIVNENNRKSSEVSFKLTYIRTATGRTRRTTITPTDNITNIGDTTKMLVTTMDFEYADLLVGERENPIVNLEVISKVLVEDDEFTPNMLIDCVILEPVLE